MSSLGQYRENIYSQNGEDGVLREILCRLDIESGRFVEFGASDGKHLSNTFNLLQGGWQGVYIEGDATRFARLRKNMEPYANRIRLLNKYVEVEGKNSLDNLLAATSIGAQFEVLSIDVDSNDWQIWESVRNHDPTIVIIEINSTIPVGIYQTHRDKSVLGSSFSSTLKLGKQKGYTAVCHTGNLIFVRDSEVSKLDLSEIEIRYPEMLFDYSWQELSYEGLAPMTMTALTRLKKKVGRAISRLWQ